MGDLEVAVVYCKNLPLEKDWRVKLRRGAQQWQTKKDRQTTSPTFDDVFKIRIANPAEPLRVEVWECNSFLPDRLVGICTVPLLGLPMKQVSLARPPLQLENLPNNGGHRGHVAEVGLQLRPLTGDFGGDEPAMSSFLHHADPSHRLEEAASSAALETTTGHQLLAASSSAATAVIMNEVILGPVIPNGASPQLVLLLNRMAQLKREKQRCVMHEDYERAALLQRELKQLKQDSDELLSQTSPIPFGGLVHSTTAAEAVTIVASPRRRSRPHDDEQQQQRSDVAPLPPLEDPTATNGNETAFFSPRRKQRLEQSTTTVESSTSASTICPLAPPPAPLPPPPPPASCVTPPPLLSTGAVALGAPPCLPPPPKLAPPPLSGGPPSVPPPPKLAPPPAPVGPPLPPGSKCAPPPPVPGGKSGPPPPPPPPPRGGAQVPPPPFGSAALKAPPKPESKTKSIFWQAVPLQAIEGSLWGTQHSTSGPAELPAAVKEQLALYFAKKPATLAAKPANGATKKGSAAGSDCAGSVLDPTRERNVGIVLQFLRLSAAQIRDAVVELDDEVLVEENIAALLSIFPSAEEQKVVLATILAGKQQAGLSYEDLLLKEPTLLSGRTAAVKFFFMCAYESSRLRLDVRMRCWLSMLRFKVNRLSVAERLEALSVATEAVTTSTALRYVLRLFLLCGNELNACVSSLASARGFRVIDLCKLKGLADCTITAGGGGEQQEGDRARKPIQHSLLAFVVRLISSGVPPLQGSGGAKAADAADGEDRRVVVQGPSVKDLLDLKDAIHAACKIDIPALVADVAELRSHLAMCSSYASSPSTSTGVGDVDKKLEPFRLFVADAEPMVKSLERSAKAVQDGLQQLLIYCGEGPQQQPQGAEPVEIFASFGQFILDVEACLAS